MDENPNIKDKAIRRAYFDLKSPATYSNIKNVYNETVQENSSVKPEDVEKYLQSEPTYSLHKTARHVFKRLKTVPTGLNTDWQLIWQMFNRLPIIINVIDIFWCA